MSIKPYQCPECGSLRFVVKFSGLYMAKINETGAGYYGQTYGYDLEGTENTIHCAECKASVTIPVFF